MKKAIDDLVYLSKIVGARFDYTQANGGNISVKKDGIMLIKQSGVELSEVESSFGFSAVKNDKVLSILDSAFKLKNRQEKEALSNKLLLESKLELKELKNLNYENLLAHTLDSKPSIETLLHSKLDSHTIHCHLLSLTILSVRSDFSKILNELFTESIMCIDYATPGIELALKVQKSSIIALKNHGIIVSAKSAKEALNLLQNINAKIAKFLKLDISIYEMASNLAQILNLKEQIIYANTCEKLDNALKENEQLFYKFPCCPDVFIHCGYHAAKLENIDSYKQEFKQMPKVLIYQNRLFFIAKNVKKAKQMQEVLRFQIEVLSFNTDKIALLWHQELDYLNNLESEKYRMKQS